MTQRVWSGDHLVEQRTAIHMTDRRGADSHPDCLLGVHHRLSKLGGAKVFHPMQRTAATHVTQWEADADVHVHNCESVERKRRVNGNVCNPTWQSGEDPMGTSS